MTSLFTSGSIVRCIDSCALIEVIDDQRLIPFARGPWVVYIEPGEISLVLDMLPSEALLLVGDKVFAFDRQNHELQDCFEVLSVA